MFYFLFLFTLNCVLPSLHVLHTKKLFLSYKWQKVPFQLTEITIKFTVTDFPAHSQLSCIIVAVFIYSIHFWDIFSCYHVLTIWETVLLEKIRWQGLTLTYPYQESFISQKNKVPMNLNSRHEHKDNGICFGLYQQLSENIPCKPWDPKFDFVIVVMIKINIL